jgi:ankyrin repeat protein
MSWAPVGIKSIIDFSTESNNFTNPEKIKVVNSNISSIEEKIHLNAITNQELKVCLKLINENISLIKNDVALGSDSEKQLRQRITNLFDTLKKIAETQLVEVATSPAPAASAAKPVPVLNMVFLCDIDCHDENGAISGRIGVAFKEEIPFITTKSLISGSDFNSDFRFGLQVRYLTILKSHLQWNIYKKGELLLFIPKSYPFNVEELGFDFSPENQITNISDVFEGPTKKTKIEDFIHLFKPNNLVNKRIILNGHGNEDYIGGLNLDHYRLFIEHLQNSGCQSLEIQSCLAGSINTIEHYFEVESPVEAKVLEDSSTAVVKQPEEKKETQTKKMTPAFPITIRSIGSFNASTSSYSESHKAYFKNLDKLLSKKGTSTVLQFKKMAQEIKASKPEDFKNFMQVKFSHQEDSPGGFRPLGEDERTQVISYVDLRGAELTKVSFIEVKDKNYVELLPLEVDIPLQITQKNPRATAPAFLSMIPGNAHHLIHEIKAERFNLLDFFRSQAISYQDCYSTKAFFIGELKLKDKTYSKVVLESTGKVMNLFWAEGDSEVYHHDQFIGGDLNKYILTESEFCFEVVQVAGRSKPHEEALRTSSGGQEDEDLFLENLMHNVFWEGPLSKGKPLPADYILYEKYKQKPTPERAEDLVKAIGPSSHQFMLQDAIISKDDYLACLLLTKGSVDVNKKNSADSYLIHIAAVNKNIVVVRLLLEKGADINKAAPPYNKTPLMVAVQKYQLEMVKLLLENSNAIDFDLGDSLGWTALQLSSFHNLEIFTLVYEAIKKKLILNEKLEGESLKNALDKHLNHMTKMGFTILSYATLEENQKCIEELLKLGADPYVGNPSALSQAIYERDKEMVEYWLEKKIDVTKGDSAGKSALDTACKAGTLEILSLILKKINLRALPQAWEYLKNAMLLGNLAKAWLLLDAGAKIEPNDNSIVGSFYGLFLSNDLKFLDKVISMGLSDEKNSNLNPEIIEIFDICLKDSSLELGKRFVKIFKKQLNYFDFSNNNLLMIAYNKKNPAMLKLLLENGADFSKKNRGISFLSKLSDADDVETLQLCRKHYSVSNSLQSKTE